MWFRQGVLSRTRDNNFVILSQSRSYRTTRVIFSCATKRSVIRQRSTSDAKRTGVNARAFRVIFIVPRRRLGVVRGDTAPPR